MASSGCWLRSGSFSKTAFTLSFTTGIRLLPPTMTTACSSLTSIAASTRARRQRPSTRSKKGLISRSKSPREITHSPEKGIRKTTSSSRDNSCFALLASACHRALSNPSNPSHSIDNRFAAILKSNSSKSSPPRWVSPAVATTSKTPSRISRIETSKVPPPRSKTATRADSLRRSNP